MKDKDLIIGAGISGLSCAWVLKDRCIVLEKDATIGGLAKTKKFNAFRSDLGGHRFFTKNVNIENFVQDLIKGDLLKIQRKSKIYRNKKFIDYPLKASVALYLNPLDVLISFFTYLLRRIKPLPEVSFEDASKNRFGDRLYELFFKVYTEKIWGVRCDKLSKEFVDARLQNISLKRVIMHALLSKQKDIKSFADVFIYPKMGINEITEALSKDLEIRLNSEVTGFVLSKDRIEKVILNNSHETECKNVISTMPLTDLTRLLEPPEEIWDSLKSLKFRSLIYVFLILKRKKYSDNHWIYFPGPQIFGRLHEPKNWSPFMAPEDKTGVGVEVFCFENDDVWKMSDLEIAHQAIMELPLLKKFEVENHFVTRIENAYPLYEVGYKEKLDKIKKFLSSYSNLFILGRTGSFSYINMDACIEEGLKLGCFLNNVPAKETPTFI